MTEQEAINLYFKQNRTSRKIIRWLKIWDPNKTATQNARRLNMLTNGAHQLARRYGLEYKRTPTGRPRKKKTRE